MNNFFIKQTKNFFNIVMPYEYIQENKEIKINKIIMYPTIKLKNLVIKATTLIGGNHLVYLTNTDLFIEYNNINAHQITLRSDDNAIDITFTFSLNELLIELSGFLIAYVGAAPMGFRNNNWDVEVKLSDRLVGQFNSKNYPETILSFSALPCKFLKVYATHSVSTSLEIDDSGKQHYSNLLCVKVHSGFPIEFGEDEFPYNSTVNAQSHLYITDEENKIIDIDEIYLFYSLF